MIRTTAKILSLSAAALLFSACSQLEKAAETTPAPEAKEAKADFPLKCTINEIASTCRTEPAAKEGFTIYFSHGDQPIFTFTPVGAPTTDRREMVDGSGQKWAMSGHRSFELEEIGGYGNEITVSNP